MAQKLQSVIDAVHGLPLSDKLELLQVLSEDLNQLYALEAGSAAFWSPKTIEELSATQFAPVIEDVRSLTTDFWPEDESAEDFSRFLAEQRHRDRMQDA